MVFYETEQVLLGLINFSFDDLYQGKCRDMGTQQNVVKRLGGNRAALFVYGNLQIGETYDLCSFYVVRMIFKFV